MTSEERHEARYQRRKQKRIEKFNKKFKSCDCYKTICNLNKLYKAYLKSRKGIRWKSSVQKFTLHLIRNLHHLLMDLIHEKDIRKGFIEFDLMERGKRRHISSVHFSERIVQRAVCDNCLVPVLANSLIYDNGASLKDKGVDFSIRRVVTFLQKYYRKYGNDGYVILIDFKSYFDNINHEILYKIIDKYFQDKQLKNLLKLFIDSFGKVGLGLGSQVCQIFAIAFINSIDHYIKEKLHIKFYHRYMDDSLLIIRTKEMAHKVLDILYSLYNKFHIKVNKHKTQIVKLSHGFTFLKTQFFLTNTGKVIQKMCHRSVVVMRRKLKKFKKFVDEGVMTFEQVNNSFQSWLGYASHKNTYRTRQNMIQLFNKLFYAYLY